MAVSANKEHTTGVLLTYEAYSPPCPMTPGAGQLLAVAKRHIGGGRDGVDSLRQVMVTTTLPRA